MLGASYQEHLKENPNIYEMPDEIYCNYLRCLFLQGKISCTRFIEDYRRYCEYSIEHDTLDEEGVEFVDSRLFQVVVNHLTGHYGKCWLCMKRNTTVLRISRNSV